MLLSEESLELEEMASDAELVDSLSVAQCETSGEKISVPIEEAITEDARSADASDSHSLDYSSEQDHKSWSPDDEPIETMIRDENQMILSNEHASVSQIEFKEMVKNCTGTDDLNEMITRFRNQVDKHKTDSGGWSQVCVYLLSSGF